MATHDNLHNQKSIDDLYSLLSVTIDLQKQILTSLKNLESNQDAPVENADPGSLSSLQKEMLRWILNSSSIKLVTGTDPSDLKKETPLKGPNLLKEAPLEAANLLKETPLEAPLEADRASPSSFENVSSKLIAHEYTKRMNADQGLVTTTFESADTTVAAADDSDNDTIRLMDQRLRDIAKTPKNAKEATGDGKNPTDLIRLQGMIAILMSEAQGREIDIREKIVINEYENLKEVSKKVYAAMIKSISKKGDAQDAAILRWSEIPGKTKSKFVALLEKKARRKLGLDIGRCQDMWAANTLLYRLVDARRKQRRISNNRHVNVTTFIKVSDTGNNGSPGITDGSNNASDAENIRLDATTPIRPDIASDINLDANTPINLDYASNINLDATKPIDQGNYATLPINRDSEKLDYTLTINQENGFNVSSPRPVNESNYNGTPFPQWIVGEKRSGLDERDEEHKKKVKLDSLKKQLLNIVHN